MNNEILLLATMIVEYSAVVLMYKFFGTRGLYLWTGIATITANIEVLILINAFGMEMTLGNILFATTFLVTDILSELHGKDASHTAVKFGIISSICFVAISSSWLLYTPSAGDQMFDSIKAIFSNTPRLIFASVSVYAIVQFLDVWLYHRWWALTEKLSGNRDRFLWLRNNGSTLISQMINAILYTIFAFAGMYDVPTLVSIAISSYVIFIVTSIMDTPFVYICRKLAREHKVSISE